MTIEQALSKNSAAVNCLNRRYKIPGGATVQAVKLGHERAGIAYTTKLIEILQDSDFSNAEGEIINTTQAINPQPKANFWGFLDNFLTGATRASGAYAQIRYDLQGRPIPHDPNFFHHQKQNNLLWIGAFVAIIIVLIIIFKK